VEAGTDTGGTEPVGTGVVEETGVSVDWGEVEVGRGNVGMLVAVGGTAVGITGVAGLQADKSRVMMIKIGKIIFLDIAVPSFKLIHASYTPLKVGDWLSGFGGDLYLCLLFAVVSLRVHR